MLDFIRNNTKILMAVVFLLIIPSFAFFGIQGYTHYMDADAKVASVDGENITQADWDAAQHRAADLETARNPNADSRLLDSPQFKYNTLQTLVRERVLAAAVFRDHLTVSDARLVQELQNDPTIASLRKPDGTLDMERYKQLLAGQGMTPERFEANVRADLVTRQVLASVGDTGLSSPAQVAFNMDMLGEQREVQVAKFTPAQFAAKVQTSDADISAYYQAHLAQYQAPDVADVQYLVFDLDAIKKGISVNEQDIKTYYDNNTALLATKEQRRISHILLAVPPAATPAEREQVKTKAGQLLAQLRAAPDKFAEMAKKESQDTVSAPNGGDLGSFDSEGKGLAAPVIAQTAFKLKSKGDISDVVSSDFGYHIIRVTEIKPSVTPSYEEAHPKLEDQLKTQQAQRQFGELAENFRDLVYEQADSLEPAAQKFGLQIQTASGVMRAPAAGSKGALANAKFLTALFATDSLEKKHNTAAIQIAANALVAGRVTKYTAAHTLPFDAVKTAVGKRLAEERATDLARKDGAAKLAAWQAQPSAAADLPAAVTVSRNESHDQPPALVEAVMRVDSSRLPQFVGVDLGADGYAIARVNKVLPRPTPSADAAKEDQNLYQQLWSIAEVMAYYNQLKDRFKVQISAPKPAGP